MISNEKFKASIKASDLTQQQACELARISKPTLIDRIDDPLQFRLSELRSIHSGMNSVGKQLLVEAVNEIFLAN